MIKKLLIIFLSLVIIINITAPLALGATETPTKTTCPPSYVGQSKCFEVKNPQLDNKTVRRSVHQRGTVVRTPGPKAMPTGTPGLNPAYLAFDLIMDQMEKDPTMSHAVNVFWNDVDKVDQAMGRVANKITASSAKALDSAFNSAIANGSNFMDVSQSVINELMNEVIKEVEKEIPEANKHTQGAIWSEQPDMQRFQKWWAKSGNPTTLLEYGYVKKKKSNGSIDFVAYGKLSQYYRVYAFSEYNDKSGFVLSTYADTTNRDSAYDTFLKYNVPATDTQELVDIKQKEVSDPDFKTTLQPPGQMWMPSGYKMFVGTPDEKTNYPGKVTITDDTVPDDEGEEYYEETVPNPNPNGTPFIKRYVKTTTPGGGVAIVEVITVDKTGKEVLPDGSTGKNPVTDPIGTVKPSPVVPPALPPKDAVTKEPDPDAPQKEPEEEGNRFKALVTNKFPFSLPWDMYKIISVLTVDPERPEIKIDTKQEIAGVSVPIKMEHDFKWMDDIIAFVRTLILISFIVFLIMKTRTLMGGAQ